MDETKKMLRAIINGQSKLREEMLTRFNNIDKRFKGLEQRMEEGFKNVNKRIDRLGKQLAYLDDDAPTGEEFKELNDRVTKIEQKIAS
jgi:tetrahydromethanopterin S-methyltransferase subunit G